MHNLTSPPGWSAVTLPAMSLRDHLLLRWEHLKRYVHPVEFLLIALLLGRSVLVLAGTFNPYAYGILYTEMAAGEDVIASLFGLLAGAFYVAFWVGAARFKVWYKLRLAGSAVMFSVYVALLLFFALGTGLVSPASWRYTVKVIACVYVFVKVTDRQAVLRRRAKRD